jgi:hypothetical protein
MKENTKCLLNEFERSDELHSKSFLISEDDVSQYREINSTKKNNQSFVKVFGPKSFDLIRIYNPPQFPKIMIIDYPDGQRLQEFTRYYMVNDKVLGKGKVMPIHARIEIQPYTKATKSYKVFRNLDFLFSKSNNSHKDFLNLKNYLISLGVLG